MMDAISAPTMFVRLVNQATFSLMREHAIDVVLFKMAANSVIIFILANNVVL